MKEILDGTVTLESFVDFVLSRVSYVPDKLARFDISRAKYNAFSGITYTDCDLLFADEERMFQVCSSWKGNVFLDDYDRAERFIAICPDIVRSEYAENIVDINLLGWPGFKAHLRNVWTDD